MTRTLPPADNLGWLQRLNLFHITPYAGRRLFGDVITTFVRGERVWDRHRLTRAYGGRLL